MNLIDFRLVITQILGFLILVWALRKWAFGPLVAIIDKRRDTIAGEFADAERRKNEAEQLRLRYEQDLRGIEAQARTRIQEAVAEGQRVAGEIKTQAQKDAVDRVARADAEIAREREKAKEMLKEHVIGLAMRSAEKILRQKLDENSQRQLVREFIDEVGATR